MAGNEQVKQLPSWVLQHPTYGPRIRGFIEAGKVKHKYLATAVPQSDSLRAGDECPDAVVLSLSGVRTQLRDICSRRACTVLNFCNITCPSSRLRSQEVAQVVEELNSTVDACLIHIYILETHPVDGWETAKNRAEGVFYRQHTSIDERVAAAQDFQRDFCTKGEVFVDELDNGVELAFEARPMRLYVVRDGLIVYRGGPGPFEYDVKGLKHCLETLSKGPA